MGGLLAFRVGNYANTAEREQFRFLCEQLKAHYENSNDFCVFAGNYNIGCELDALFIKKDAIIAIEFKNYGGRVVATENGEWKCDGQIIKGGSRKTVLQQARINHSIVRKELKMLGVEGRNIKDVPTLVIFNQPIELVNNLSATTKSWLHITDNEHFVEKIDDITCPHTDLDPLGIVTLAELLNLNSFYLEEYSNANYDKPTTPPDSLEIFDDIKTYERKPSGQEVDTEGTQINVFIHEDNQSEEQKDEVLTEESKNLKGFVRQILKSFLKLSDAVVTIWDGASSREYMAKFGIAVNKRLLVKVESNGIGKYCSKLSKFINNDVKAINPDLICWQDGDFIDDIHEESTNLNDKEQGQAQWISLGDTIVNFHKSKTVLPHWLDLLLFNNLGAIYSPEHKKFEYNLNNDSEDIKIYLGTYFPRSYAESFCIFDDLFKTSPYIEVLKNAPELNILDFGCGTGGELVGLIVALSKHVSSSKVINVRAIDGNHNALISMGKITETLSNNTRHRVCISYEEKACLCEKDIQLKDENGKYHFILNSKMVCELVSKKIVESNCYYKIAEILSPFLANNGLLYILDVTTKDEYSQLFYPQLMNQGLNSFISSHNDYNTLLPLACNNWKDCQEACFMQQTFTISHSRKSDDESRVCYRIICKNDFVNTFISENSLLKKCTHIIHPQKYKQDDNSSLCPKSINGNIIIDSYNIKL